MYLGRNATGTGTINIGAASGQTAAAAGYIDAPTIEFGEGDGTLVFNHTGLADAFEVDLMLVSNGAGTHKILHEAGWTRYSGDGSGFSGTTEIDGGSLSVDGALGGTVNVNDGGFLQGTGVLTGLLNVNSGGVFAPGNSIGTLTVNGGLAMGSGSTFEVEVDAAGNSDKVIVNGTVNLTGAALQVLAEAGDYADTTDYTIIENDGTDAVSGTFGTVSVNSAFLTASVDYDGGTGNDVVLMLEGMADDGSVTFTPAAQTGNQRGVANALDKFPTSNALYEAIFSLTSFAEARQAFNALSGEVHATVAGTLVDDSRYAREAVLGRLKQAGHQGGALGNGGPKVA